jgi:hypothetical protein
MMGSLLRARTTAVWLLLVGATVLSWEVGHGVGFDDVRHAGIAILVVAFIKVRLVILDFMELRHAPLPFRIIGEIGPIGICAFLIAMYLRTA